MFSTPIRSLLTLSLVGLLSVTASAQQQGGDFGDVQTPGLGGATQTGQTTGTDTGSRGRTAGEPLSAETAFDAVQREGTVGGTASSGAGPSASGAGGAGGGGFGGGGALGGLGGLGGLGNLFGGLGGGVGQTQSTRIPLRTRLRSAVSVAPMPAQQIQANANRLFQTLPDSPTLRGVRVNMREQTAVLSGVVKSERDRRMSELLMRLEPGVRSVENRLNVSP